MQFRNSHCIYSLISFADGQYYVFMETSHNQKETGYLMVGFCLYIFQVFVVVCWFRESNTKQISYKISSDIAAT